MPKFIYDIGHKDKHPQDGIFRRIAPASGGIELTEQNQQTLAGLPVWAIVGTADRIVAPYRSINFIAALKERGADAQISVLEGVSHFDVPKIYLDHAVGLIQWLIGGNETSIQSVSPATTAPTQSTTFRGAANHAPNAA